MKLKKIQIIISMVLAVLLAFSFSFTAGAKTDNTSSGKNDVISDLIDFSNIDTTLDLKAHGAKKTTYLNQLKDGNFQVVIHYDGSIYVLLYDSKYQLQSSRCIPLELPIWGGFHNDGENNYVVCGQVRNESAEKGGEVYRFIKYDKNFQRIAAVSAYSNNTDTRVPFDGANVSIASNGNSLIVYTGRQRLDLHQENTGFKLDTNKMDSYVFGAGAYYTFVSHDFRQIVKYDGDNPVFADLSDASPVRSVYLQTHNGGGPLINIPGQAGDNVTNAEVSGLEISKSHYLVTGMYLNNSTNNVYLSTYDKNSKSVNVSWLTNTVEYEGEYGIPHILKIGEDRFIVYWPKKFNNLQYVITNGKGEPIGAVKTLNGVFSSDCEPVYTNGKVCFIVARNGQISFVEISDLSVQGEFALENQSLPSRFWKGDIDTSWYDSQKTTFYLSTENQLAGLASMVNSGEDFAGKYINLNNDMYLNEKPNTGKYEWIPIGKEDSHPFNGTFNGNGFSIFNAYVSGKYEGGLFGYVGSNGLIKAVDIKNSIIVDSGALTYENSGIIMFCNNFSLVYDSGAISYRNENLLYGCKNFGTVKGSSVAGISTWNGSSATISSCANCGILSASSYANGIISSNHGFVYDCYNSGVISGGDGFSIFQPTEIRIHGIGENNGFGNESERMTNCYVSYLNLSYGTIWHAPIATEPYSNCYIYNKSMESNMISASDSFSDEDIQTGAIVNKLNGNQNTILPGWLNDTHQINGGMPITIADNNASRGIYKMIPEMWGNTINIVEGNVTRSYSLYFCEAAPKVTLEDSSFASLNASTSKSGINLQLTPKRKGRTNIIFEFMETENNCAFTYKMPINIQSGSTVLYGDVNNDNIVDAKDRIKLSRYLAKWKEYAEIDALVADVNNDNKVNAKDRIILSRHLAKWDGYETLP